VRVVVTGGYGFLGQHVVQELIDQDHVVFAPRSKNYDLREKRECRRLIKEQSPDAIVHLAARVGGIGDNVSRPGEFLYDNAVMGLHLMDVARDHGVGKMLTVGTACMYPATPTMPMVESEIFDGEPAFETGAYAHAKRLLLSQGIAYAEQYDFNAVFVVPTNLYGPLDRTTHVVPQMTKKFSEALDEGGPVILWGSGSPTRDFLYVGDCAEGIVQALLYHNEPYAVNLGTGVETPIWALAHAIAWELGYDGEIIWDPTRPEGAGRRALDSSLAKQKFGWSAHTNLRDGLRKYLEWFKS